MTRRKIPRKLLGTMALLASVGLAPALAQCGPRRANPCMPQAVNPCAPKKAGNPCAAANPCGANPCAPCGPCAPCAPCGPCAPCAPCGPCALCGPCDPCAPGEAAILTDDQAAKLYAELANKLKAGYEKSGVEAATEYQGWKKYNTVPYRSETHGNRYVNNYANPEAAAEYGAFDSEKVLPVGSIIAKDSIDALPDGKAKPGPLFLMEKMEDGFNEPSADWRYTLIGADGTIVGKTKGQGSDNVTFCYECHQAAGASQLFFLPDEYRVK